MNARLVAAVAAVLTLTLAPAHGHDVVCPLPADLRDDVSPVETPVPVGFLPGAGTDVALAMFWVERGHLVTTIDFWNLGAPEADRTHVSALRITARGTEHSLQARRTVAGSTFVLTRVDPTVPRVPGVRPAETVVATASGRVGDRRVTMRVPLAALGVARLGRNVLSDWHGESYVTLATPSGSAPVALLYDWSIAVACGHTRH